MFSFYARRVFWVNYNASYVLQDFARISLSTPVILAQKIEYYGLVLGTLEDFLYYKNHTSWVSSVILTKSCTFEFFNKVEQRYNFLNSNLDENAGIDENTNWPEVLLLSKVQILKVKNAHKISGYTNLFRYC